ncbi:UDP-N-acetylglucosamine 2-epimerase [Almyronema epifaneia]|uniref:UDP-N-acetylglucosamine 2-epimerase n=1 Tax=Almyronema epifaneia S1 TaxID=2991925 RepID=A0ABW6IHJ4_9CYAN
MALKLSNLVRKVTDPLEAQLLGNHYFSLQQYLSYRNKWAALQKSFSYRLAAPAVETQPEIIFFLYSKACERMLMPLLLNLLQRSEVRQQVRLSVVLLENIHRLRLSAANSAALAAANCPVQSDYFSLVRACSQPQNKLVVMCLDHRSKQAYHRCGVETADKLRQCGVKTLSIQHGGTRRDSVVDLSTAASDTVLVWGQRVHRQLINQYDVDPQRLRLVGNPLHDRLAQLNPAQAKAKLLACYPKLRSQLADKSVILLATTLQAEYADQPDEQRLYREYVSHLYRSVDFSKYLLIVKMHPLDSLTPNLYQMLIPDDAAASIVVVEPSLTELDVYSLLSIADLLITRASTVAEEALIMQRRVIAFDLKPNGPAKGYQHLEEYGSYTTVYQHPTDQLKKAIAAALDNPQPQSQPLDTVADLTYRLDGQSTTRAADALLAEVGWLSPPLAAVQVAT